MGSTLRVKGTMNLDEARLSALARYDILDTPPEVAFDTVVEIAKELCQTPIALVSLVDRDRQWFKARAGLDVSETPISQSVCAHAIELGETLVIPDLAADPRTSENPLVRDDPRIRFYAGSPIVTADRHVLGTVCVIDLVPRPAGLTMGQLRALELLAQQAMSQIEYRRGLTLRDEVIADERREGEQFRSRALMSDAERERFRLSDERSRMAQEAGAIGTFEIDIATGEVDTSAEFCRLFGLPVRPSYPVSILEGMVIPEDRELASSQDSRTRGTAEMEVEYRVVRGDDGSTRWLYRRGRLWPETGAPVRMYGTVQDMTDRRESERRMAALLRLGDALRDVADAETAVRVAAEILGRTLNGLRAGYIFVNPDDASLAVRCEWNLGSDTSVAGDYPLVRFADTLRSMAGGEPLVVYDLRDAGPLSNDLSGYVGMGTRALLKIPLLKAGKVEGILFVHSAVARRWTKAEIDFAEAVADRTHASVARLEAEERQNVLNHELSHRLKNTLAMVSGIASQTLKSSSDRAAVRAFNDRIQALSQAHDILLQENWTSARIRPIVRAELELHAPIDRYTIDGPDLRLRPGAALALSLLLHELATNALKYGALSVPTGIVDVDWSVTVGEDGGDLVLRWREQGGPPVVPPERRGFGSRLISAGLGPNGEVDVRYVPTGLEAEFRVRLSLVSEA